MGKAARHVYLLMIRRGKHCSKPSAKRWRTAAHVNNNVENFSLHYAAQLRLRMLQLIMQPANRSLHRFRVIILDEVIGYPKLGEFFAMIAFHKKSARVGEHLGLNQKYPGQRSFNPLQWRAPF